MSENWFDNSLLLVTGAGGGIGRAICKIASERGCRVVVADINLNTAKETVATLTDPSKHLPIKMDVSSKSSVEESFNQIKKKYSTGPSLLVNCAGILKMAKFQDHSEDDFNDIINTHLKGTFLVTNYYIQLYKEMSFKKGAIVNIGSVVGRDGYPNMSVYSAAKAGIDAFTKSISKELGSIGIRVNCVRPGPIKTNMLAKANASPFAKETIITPSLNRDGQPEEIAESVLFLLSDKSSFTTGSLVDVNGGL